MRRENERYARNDMILIIFLCVIAVGLSVVIYMGKNQSELAVEILINGELVEKVTLNDNMTEEISLDTGNIICIHDGCVYMKSADCPDGLCVKQGEIDKAGESIICLPHKVVVRLVSISGESDEDGLDVMPK